jgi:hypothetical protein
MMILVLEDVFVRHLGECGSMFSCSVLILRELKNYIWERESGTPLVLFIHYRYLYRLLLLHVRCNRYFGSLQLWKNSQRKLKVMALIILIYSFH